MSELTEVRAQLRAQQAVIEHQAEMLCELRTQVAALQRAQDALPGATHPHPDHAAADDVTDRRHLLTRAATAAAGAVVGGAALALTSASPASAAIVETGNPAVVGNADPTSGTGVRGTSSSGSGVQGNSLTGAGVEGGSNWRGVVGTTSGGTGVYGTSSSGTGVDGRSLNGTGVYGDSTNGPALHGVSTSADGVRAATGGVGASNLRFTASGSLPAAPPSTTIYRPAGSVVRDSSGDLWLCVGSGSPGTWRKIGGPNTSGALHVLATPQRVYDSRPGFAPALGTKAPLVGGVSRDCDLKANSSGIPAGATAVLVSLVATGTTGSAGGFLAVYRNGIAWPGTSNLNWSGPGQNIAVTTITAVDTNAVCTLYANVATDVVVDVLGFFR